MNASVQVQPALKLLTIHGRGRAKSAVLGSLLAQRSGAINGGELGSLFDYAARSRPCTCDVSLFDCPFWGPVIACVEQDTHLTVGELAIECAAVESGGGEPGVWRSAWSATVVALRELHGVQTMIDSSKTAQGRHRVALLASLEEVDLSLAVYLQRRFDGEAHRPASGVEALLEDGQQGGSSTLAALTAMVGWNRTEQAASCQGGPIPYRRVGYNTLVASPGETVDELLDAAGWRARRWSAQDRPLDQEPTSHALGDNPRLDAGAAGTLSAASALGAARPGERGVRARVGAALHRSGLPSTVRRYSAEVGHTR